MRGSEQIAATVDLTKVTKPTGITVTRLASGLPMGSDIEYADDLTLMNALRGRVTLAGGKKD